MQKQARHTAIWMNQSRTHSACQPATKQCRASQEPSYANRPTFFRAAADLSESCTAGVPGRWEDGERRRKDGEAAAAAGRCIVAAT